MTNIAQNVQCIQWMYYPRNQPIDSLSKDIVDIFQKNHGQFSSHNHNLQSNAVLAIVRNDLQSLGFTVENKPKTIVSVPVLYGKNGVSAKSFNADAYYSPTNGKGHIIDPTDDKGHIIDPTDDKGYIIEVEAGRAVTNYQFLKDFFEGCTMVGVDKICIAVRNIYRESKDFDNVCVFFDALYTSGRLKLPISGLLIIGY